MWLALSRFRRTDSGSTCACQESILANANAGREVPFSEVVQGFYHAIDWSEPWIIALLTAHVVTLVVRRGRGKFKIPKPAADGVPLDACAGPLCLLCVCFSRVCTAGVCDP